MSLFGESNAHKQWRYQRDTNEQLQQFNLENMEIQQGYNLENMARQFNYNVQAFNMENEYNSPLAQRQRMSQAGLNPNWSDGSAIGQMDSGVNSSTPAGGAPGNSSMPTANPTQDMLALGQAYQNIMESRSRIALNEAEKHKAESEANANNYRLSSDKRWLDTERLTATSLQQAQQHYHENKALLDDKELEYFDYYRGALISNIEAMTDKTNEEKKVLIDTLPAILAQYAANTKKALSESNKYDVEASYVPYEAKSRRILAESSAVHAFASKMDAETNRFLSSSQKTLNDALSGKYTVEKQIDLIDKELKDIQLDTEKYAKESGLTKYERYYLSKRMRKEYYKTSAEIGKILSDTNKNNALKIYLINQSIRGWIDSATDILSPFMPGAGKDLLHDFF